MDKLKRGETVSMPLPLPELQAFDELPLRDLKLEIDPRKRALVVTGNGTVAGLAADIALVGRWPTGDDKGRFFLLVKPPKFTVGDVVKQLKGSPLDEVTLGGSILTLSGAETKLEADDLPAAATSLLGDVKLDLRPGLNLYRRIKLADLKRLELPPGPWRESGCAWAGLPCVICLAARRPGRRLTSAGRG